MIRVRIGFALAGLLALSGCGGCPEEPERTRLEAWADAHAVADAKDAARALESARAAEGLPLPFWAGEGASEDPTVAAIFAEHPCGPIAVAFVATVPAHPGKGGLEPELVVEIDDSGGTVRSWSIPADTIVDGVRGEELLVPQSFDGIVGRGEDRAPAGVRLAVRPDGAYRVEDAADGLPSPESAVCPTLSHWGESSYVRCWTFRDAADGTARTLAYQGPCT